MKYLNNFKKFENKYNNMEVNVYGLQCDNPNCDYEDMSVPFSDYEKFIGKPCPKCGENLLTQEDYDKVMQMVDAAEIMNMFSPEELQKIAANLSPEEMDQVLDTMNLLKMKKEGDTDDGREIWSM
jgi:acetyl-CoA carboxylase beta subunit